MKEQDNSFQAVAGMALRIEPDVSFFTKSECTVVAIQPQADNDLVGSSVRSALKCNQGRDLIVVENS